MTNNIYIIDPLSYAIQFVSPSERQEKVVKEEKGIQLIGGGIR